MENALHAMSGKYKKALKLAKVEQAHYRIDVGVRQEYPADWGWRGIIRRRSEFVGREHLLTKIRRSTQQEPNSGIRREDYLGLRTRTSS